MTQLKSLFFLAWKVLLSFFSRRNVHLTVSFTYSNIVDCAFISIGSLTLFVINIIHIKLWYSNVTIIRDYYLVPGAGHLQSQIGWNKSSKFYEHNCKLYILAIVNPRKHQMSLFDLSYGYIKCKHPLSWCCNLISILIIILLHFQAQKTCQIPEIWWRRFTWEHNNCHWPNKILMPMPSIIVPQELNKLVKDFVSKVYY